MSAEATAVLMGGRHLQDEAAWNAYKALGGDEFAANHRGWIRRSCPAHESVSGNSCGFRIDNSTGKAVLLVKDFAGCTERQILEAIGVDTAGMRGIDEEPVEQWLARGAARPASFPPFEDPATPAVNPDRALEYFAQKRGFDVEALRRAGVVAVQHPHRCRVPVDRHPHRYCDRALNLRARFPFTIGGQLVGAWDRAILDVAPGGRRWVMSGTIPVPFGWDSLAVARDTGHVYIVEGPTDAVALMHALPGAAVLGAGVGRSMWKPWWGSEFRWLTVWLFTDNDLGGAMTRRVAHEVLDRHAFEVIDVQIPRRHNDLDDWRRSAGDNFRAEILQALQQSATPAWSAA